MGIQPVQLIPRRKLRRLFLCMRLAQVMRRLQTFPLVGVGNRQSNGQSNHKCRIVGLVKLFDPASNGDIRNGPDTDIFNLSLALLHLDDPPSHIGIALQQMLQSVQGGNVPYPLQAACQ